jgi:hypothetical protein
VQPAVAFGMRRIVWVFNNVFGLVELVEPKAAELVLGEQRPLLLADDPHVRRPTAGIEPPWAKVGLMQNIVYFIRPCMSKMQDLQPAVMCRRRFFHSIGGLAVSLLFGDISFLASNVPTGEQGFVIVNGWVLTFADLAGSQVTNDVV